MSIETGRIVQVLVGHESRMLDQPTSEGHTHRWTLFVRPANTDIVNFSNNKFIKKVKFSLHESFPNPVRTLREPPFEVSETGYGGFSPNLTVSFNLPNQKSIKFFYDMNLTLEKTGYHAQVQKLSITGSMSPSFLELVNKYCAKKKAKRKSSIEEDKMSPPLKKPKKTESPDYDKLALKKPTKTESPAYGKSSPSVSSVSVKKSKKSGSPDYDKKSSSDEKPKKEKSKEKEREKTKEKDKDREKEKAREKEREREKQKRKEEKERQELNEKPPKLTPIHETASFAKEKVTSASTSSTPVLATSIPKKKTHVANKVAPNKNGDKDDKNKEKKEKEKKRKEKEESLPNSPSSSHTSFSDHRDSVEELTRKIGEIRDGSILYKVSEILLTMSSTKLSAAKCALTFDLSEASPTMMTQLSRILSS